MIKQNSRRKTLSINYDESPNIKIRTRQSVYMSTPVSKIPENQEALTPCNVTPKGNERDHTLVSTPVSKLIDPIMARIQRDLNSSSATAKLRAQRALKSPGFRKANYEIFDIPYEEQDIITEEERQPYRPKTIPEIFSNCRIYVEVRTGDDNRSAGIKNKLLLDGIKVNDKLYRDTTHVIFKDGLLSTYKKAKKFGIPITNILWIEECKTQRRLVDPSKFPIYNAERYENPEIYGRVRRQKSSQPEISKIVTQKSHSVIDDSYGNITINKTVDKEETHKTSSSMEISNDTESTIINVEEVEKVQESTSKATNTRRLTTFTPRPMEQTKCDVSAAWKTIERRKTMFTSHLEETKISSPFISDTQTPKTECNNVAKSIFFNSGNRIASIGRRSIIDISMNILELNCKAINEKAKERNAEESRVATDNDVISLTSSDSNTSSSLSSLKSTQVPATTIVRKRKLFCNDTFDDLNDSKENISSSNSSGSIKKVRKEKSFLKKENEKPFVAKIKEDRRKTISYFKPSKPTESVKTPKASLTTKYIVCTNMSAAEKQKTQIAIFKLGGVLENEVSEKTTHIVTPTTDRTMNLLRGIIRACYILKPSWITESETAGKFLDTTLYHHDICNTQKVYERRVLGRNFKNLIFSHYGPFFINNDSIENPKKIEYLKEIIERCSGKLTKNKYEAKIIISDRPVPLYPSIRKPTVVQSTYIFDAAMQSKMLPIAKYVPKN